ncbi:(deoxy)nucleoside triphosphate pyrophosphohydrolase [Alloiococcus sp. CFN-8]|uniref:(deoxy)nucleoside triphosphate pyrophosphohydrolase n=1 Tax=Alloiococcus sp. CFN-8 TaxID=3416081 RepID=UPI003CF91DF1
MKTIRVVAAIIKNEDKVFTTQRGYGDFEGGWEFPGGKIEEGESKEVALIREIKEELAVEISVDKYVLTVEYDYPNFHLTMDCFLCSLRNGDIKLMEHSSAKWLDKYSLDSVDWLPADIEVVNELKKIL